MITELPLYNKLLILLINFIAIWLAIIVYNNNRRGKLNKMFLGMIVSMFLWVDFAYLARLMGQQTPDLGLIFLKIAWSASPFLFVSLYFLVVFYLNKGKRYLILNKIIFLSGFFISLITISTDLVVKEIEFIGINLTIIYGKGMFPFLGIIFFFMCIPLYLLFKEYIKCAPKKKIKIEYLLAGIFIFYLANIIFGIIFPVFLKVVHLYWIGDYSAIFLLGFTAYAIVKHELMGIKTLLTQVLIVIISIVLIVDVFLLSDDIIVQLIKTGILITFLYFSRELVKSVRKEMEARKELEDTYKKINQYIVQLKKINKNTQEKNEDLESLLSLSNVSSSGMEIDKNIQDMLDIIPVKLGHLKILGAIMVRYDEKNNKAYSYTVTQSKLLQKAIKILPKKVLSDYHTSITPETPSSGKDNPTADSIIENKIKTGEVLADFINPPVDRPTARLMQKIMGAKSIASAPINIRGARLGAIIFIFAKPLSEIKDRDLDLMRAFTQHLGVVLENLQFYHKLNKNIEELTCAKNNLKEMLSIKNEFLHITSHQLRTPLTAIRGMLSMWYEGDFEDLSKKEKRKMLKRILVSTDRLNNITNDMLDALELEGGFLKFQFKPVSIVKIVKETIDTLKPNFENKNIYIKLITDSEIPSVEVEPNYIRQVFMNVIDNACKYTKKGGASINIKKYNKYVKIIIKDTGVGISKTDQKKIFEKFTRGRNIVSENASGSGLGLFIARKIVNAHGGKIEIESDGVGRGSTVKIYLKIKHSE
ncbi:hypothetical protein KAT63_02830 [Candidatus Parcubacteria bacterium]|nr:hypothetical protein [Candidatus Parcubacteria bacterium]